MAEIYFIVRYTPFWAIPLLMISMEFAYLFWVRKKKKLIAFCMTLATLSFSSLVFYYYIGGPEKSVRFLMEVVRYYR